MTTREEYQALAEAIRRAGYHCLRDYKKGGFWIRSLTAEVNAPREYISDADAARRFGVA